jgi:asparagine synthase (glutamine-hydrolysing)
VPREIDSEAIYHYFTLGYIPHPWSIYRNVRQLPPAHRLIVEGGRIKIDHYWKLVSRVDQRVTSMEWGERLRALLTDAVRIRMVSDVPLGAFLSGGLDSSIVVALMAQQASAPVRTFHVDFGEPDFSERRYAQAVASRYGTEHHEMVVRPSATGLLDQLVGHYDEPFGDSSAIPTYYLSQYTRQYVTVALAGDGGDEGFGGYERYVDVLGRRELLGPFRTAAGVIGRAIHRALPRTAPGRRYFRSLGMNQRRYFAVGTTELETRELLSPDFLQSIHGVSTFELLEPHMAAADPTDALAPYAMLDIHRYLPDDILTKVDRASMAHSLEVRGPFLDYRIMELAAAIPHRWKIVQGNTKVLLKETFARDLPPEVLEPRKRGFSIPLERWFRNELRGVLEDSLNDRLLEQSGFLNMSEWRELAREHWSGARNRKTQLWRFLFFARWWRQFSETRERPVEACVA